MLQSMKVYEDFTEVIILRQGWQVFIPPTVRTNLTQ